MPNKYVRLPYIFFAAWTAWSSSAMAQQESLYSQYMFNRLVINPAYAGVKGHLSFTGLFRTQWVNFNDRRPQTFVFSGHGAIGRSRDKVSHGLGGFIGVDRNGLLETTVGSLTYAFRIPVGNRSFLSLGLSAGAQQWTLRGADIRTDQPGDPVFPDQTQTVWRPDVGAGAFLNTPVFYAGLSTAHLVEFDLPFTKSGEQAKISRHYFLTSGVDLRLGNRVVLTPSVFFRYVARAPLQSDL
ncbi:MAG: type IX secretion system membrane protein PorP/SprF, partial [Bacteroidia bacterium]|nr:type IX secretion system membrane protein PorP/SprF [Bacteroidia bacterium]MDW8334838.1 type IX secretion system membrane protein PorP/SprF [Bacteroidia bacterium]